ncbi:MAG: NADH-quinone oxidoreductase subunit E [Acidimicrobiia bacterium]|nr:NADH-quinone oxidoreductase subunit E [Acidimicrobiia bacterium]MYG92663.1 NADH-quinone oxidoreductase subunit E [Acidimicrobiia bacterium]
MDLRFTDAQPTAAEREAVDSVLGPAGVDSHQRVRTASNLRIFATGMQSVSDRRHLLLPALETVQSEIGWVSEGALMHICRELSVPPAEAWGVATFYSLISVDPSPPVVLHICDDIVCRRAGALELMEGLESNGRTPDARWLPSPCLGQCDRAPAAYVQRAGEDDEVLVSINPETRPMGPDGSILSTNGQTDTVAVPQAGEPHLRLLRRVGTVDPGSLDSYLEAGGYRALEKAVEMGPAAVVAEVKASGLRGRGGAAFPAWIKWEAVANSPEQVRYLICNADESEPGTFKDRVLMEDDPFSVIEAMTISGLAVGARQGYLYIRGEYPLATRRLRSAIHQARRAGLLGESTTRGFSFDIDLRRGQGAYICGEETALMNSIEGLRGEPRNKPPFPTDSGLFGKPTVINNVETLCNVLDIVTDGGNSFASSGTPQSTGPKLFCLSGSVRRPGTYEVEFGATLGDLIALAGGLPEGRRLRAVLLGGAAGSFVLPDLLEMPLTFEAASEAGISLGSGVIMAFDQHTDFGDILARIAAFFRDETCGQCVPCRVGTVRVEEALARIRRDPQPGDSKLIEEIDLAMRDASICGLGHTAAIALRSALELGLLE